MKEHDYQMARRYMGTIKRYEDMKLKINELYNKVRDPTDLARKDSDVKDLAEMILGMTEEDAGRNVLSDLVYARVAYYEENIKRCKQEFDAL